MAAPEDPQVADLTRYRKAREAARRRAAARPSGPGLLGANPRAGLYLVLIVLIALALFGWPLIHRLIA